ncbi:unnamed protein product [Chilo suppressalis]|uniref:BZIP domain-containing protein n=1 Tax=Chilo suppressalis TaxID=168631 RepID=A0ABN8B069_CHISP|nr:unnamed protein product [Chilo suppressalis]
MEYQHQPLQPLGPPAPPPQLLPPAPPPPLPSLPQLQHAHAHAHAQEDDRWNQYHIWRQHVFVNARPYRGNTLASACWPGAGGQVTAPPVAGKSVNAKDALEDKKDDNELWEAQAAFLGPNLWDKTLPYDPDLKVQEVSNFITYRVCVSLTVSCCELADANELVRGCLFGCAWGPEEADCGGVLQYVDLDEFLSENGMPGEALAFSMASSGRDFDPRTRAFSDEELKPQPMIKKSRKQFVPDDLKDDKYWARRRKNNMAAKRSRDARRMKENQIALRAGYLEKENMGLRQEVELLKKENHILREKLSKYADV